MSAELSIKSAFKLHTGNPMPKLGFGVYKSERHVCEKSIATAIECGYRHIDSAQYYENEDLVGKAATSNPSVPRQDLFITTKILFPPSEPTVEKILPSLRESVQKMCPVPGPNGKPYVDLFLIHTPSSGPEGRLCMWKALIELQKIGEAKDIGVSNFGIRHLEQLKETGVKPVVNQLELHPWCQQREIAKYCKENDIVLQAYSPLVRQERTSDETLQRIAKETSKDTNQVLIRWSLQKGFSPLPKSDTPSRIKSNADVFGFSLSDEQMAALDKLGEGKDQPICPFNVNCP